MYFFYKNTKNACIAMQICSLCGGHIECGGHFEFANIIREI